jgi:hypothetical protein
MIMLGIRKGSGQRLVRKTGIRQRSARDQAGIRPEIS